MHYYLALTSKCNLLCKYCYGKSVEDFLTEEEAEKYDTTIPDKINFGIDDLIKFSSDDSDFTLTFYGGEPLLKIDLIKDIIDKVPAKEFMLQTNGVFLHKLDSAYLNRLSTILVSIDGTPSHTDDRRGEEVYQKIIENVKLIRSNGYQGEIIARMTVDESCDILENVKYLYENKDFPFSSVHWQIDAQFWKSDYEQRDFKAWSINEYNPKIKQLINWWLDEIKESKKVRRIYPFIGVMHSILNNEKSPLKCGAGHSTLGIQTNGVVAACPITAGCKPLYQGDIRTSTLNDIKENRINPTGPCLSCEIKDICGGRCLYANKTMLWGEEGFREVCDTIFFLVNSLKSIEGEIREMIEKGELRLEDFDYPKYNGAEIIP